MSRSHTRRAPWIAATALALLLSAYTSPARAIVAESAPRGGIELPAAGTLTIATGERQRTLASSPAWQAFRARHGDWGALWNATTGSPHRASGPSIPLAGFANDSAAVDAVLRAFVANNPALFGAGVVIAPRSIRRHGDVWYASYRQLVGGLEVLFADWEFRVASNGRLMLFGADAWPLQVPPRSARIARAAASAAAIAGLDFTPARDAVEFAGDPALLPFVTASGITAHLVMPMRVRTTLPLGNWFTLVDAATGEVLMRTDCVRHVTGHVTGLIHPRLPTDPLTPRNFVRQYVTANAFSVPTEIGRASCRERVSYSV